VTADRVERRLAAILAADVAGYSRLMGTDEEGTLAQLKAIRKSLIDPAVAAHRGRTVKTTGDGLLLEFASAVDAARWAIALQQGSIFASASMSATSSSTRTISSATASISPRASKASPSPAAFASPTTRCARFAARSTPPSTTSDRRN
jgi:hypothetical protein